MKRTLVILAALAAACASRGPRTFESAEAAVRDLVEAFRSNDVARAEEVLGDGAPAILFSGDDVADARGRAEFVRLYDESHKLERDGDTRLILVVGTIEWPVPVPLVRGADGWFFDTDAGKEEILARRVGRNELSTIQVCLACRDAQREYAAVDRDGDGILEYAPRFLSSEGKRDGLYWAVPDGEPPSPLGPLVAEAVREGYRREAKPHPYHGYYYRMLRAQGEHAADGACDYCVGEDMIGGFAFVAYPAEYGNSGVMTFLVSHEGVVYEKDLGPESSAIAESMEAFDPGEGWKPTSP